MVNDSQVNALRKLAKECAVKRETFRVKNIGIQHDDKYISGCLLHSSILRFLDSLDLFKAVYEHREKRPKDRLFFSNAFKKLKKTGLLTDRKVLKSRTGWTPFDKQCKDIYMALLREIFLLFEVKS